MSDAPAAIQVERGAVDRRRVEVDVGRRARTNSMMEQGVLGGNPEAPGRSGSDGDRHPSAAAQIAESERRVKSYATLHLQSCYASRPGRSRERSWRCNRSEVIERLHAEGSIPIRASQASEGLLAGLAPAHLFRRRKLSPTDIVVITQELATLLHADLPIDRALGLIGDLAEGSAKRNFVNAFSRVCAPAPLLRTRSSRTRRCCQASISACCAPARLLAISILFWLVWRSFWRARRRSRRACGRRCTIR